MIRLTYSISAIAVGFLIPISVIAQGAGAAYAGGQYGPQHKPEKLDFKTATKVIAVTGTVEQKIDPEKLRLVFAIVAERGTAAECSKKIKLIQKSITEAVSSLGITASDINGDFISVTPTYEWENDEEEMMVRQKLSGYKMQHNLHAMCGSEEVAMKVIDIAFENGISDIIAFDYWHSGIDEQKKAARKKAIESAKEKSAILFEVFDSKPKPINVQEKTTVHKPSTMYRTFSRSSTQRISIPRNWRDRAQIFAPTPQLTYLENLAAQTDIQGKTPALKPQISVLSTVTIYYSTPK